MSVKLEKLSDRAEFRSAETDGMIRQRISLVTAKAICMEAGIDKDAFSRFFNNQNGIGLTVFIRVLALLGLKIVDRNQMMCPEGYVPVQEDEVLLAYKVVRKVLPKDSPQLMGWTKALTDYGSIIVDKNGRVSVPLED